MKKFAVLSFSGGMDSSSLLLKLLAQGFHVTTISIDYGQKHKIELEKASQLIQLLQSKNLNVKHQNITISGISELLESSLVEGGDEIPTGHYSEENMKSTVVPNRNKIFSSIIQSIALSISLKTDSEVLIAMGAHAGDHDTYPDCRPIFRDKDYEAFITGNYVEAEKVKYYLPYIELDKSQVLKDGLNSCNILELDFKEVYNLTHTSYSTVKINNELISDYSSSASVSRIEAFINNQIQDPIPYADPLTKKILDWNNVSQKVQKIIHDFEMRNNI